MNKSSSLTHTSKFLQCICGYFGGEKIEIAFIELPVKHLCVRLANTRTHARLEYVAMNKMSRWHWMRTGGYNADYRRIFGVNSREHTDSGVKPKIQQIMANWYGTQTIAHGIRGMSCPMNGVSGALPLPMLSQCIYIIICTHCIFEVFMVGERYEYIHFVDRFYF